MEKERNQNVLSDFVKELQFGGTLNRLSYRKGYELYEMGRCHLLTSGSSGYSYEVKDDYQDFLVSLKFDPAALKTHCSCNSHQLCSHVFAAALQTQQEMNRSSQISEEDALKYSREGMIKRVMEEREERARQESYQLDFADNIYGEHHLITGKDKTYRLSFYDFDQRLGYCSCPDYQTNKLETCKHLIYAFHEFLKKNDSEQLPKQAYPFLEIFRHPLKDYQVSWFYPHLPDPKIATVLKEFFDDQQVFKKDQLHRIYHFLELMEDFKSVKVRPEVKSFVAQYFETASLKERFSKIEFPQNILKNPIFKYQEEGSLFIASKKGSILADEIGLGKSVQALSSALIKYKYLGFTNIKILCPIHLMDHWNSEIEKWIPEDKRSFFQVIDFEEAENHQNCDFLIIDEAQKIDDFKSGILYQVHHWEYQHILLITDSQISTSLIKFYAMAALFDSYLLTPLWELSYKHCLFSSEDPSKIVGYYHLDQVYARLKMVYLRRNKIDVLEQLPPADFVKIPVALTETLSKHQSSVARKVKALAKKEPLHHYDLLQFKSYLQRLMKLGQFCYWDTEKQYSNPKLEEFMHFVNHKLNLQKDEKVIVFVNSKTTQIQLQRLLQEDRKQAAIWEKESAIKEEDLQFFITEEKLQKDLPLAHHFIYYHWPQPVHYLEERIQLQKKTQLSLHLNRFYVLETNHSLDALINRWQKEKPHFLHQLLQFLSHDKKVVELGLRLREELIHELKAMIVRGSGNKTIPDFVQMDLFEKPRAASFQASSAEPDVKEEALQVFFEKLLEIYTLFDAFSEKEKESLKKSKLSISNLEEEMVIRLRK